MKMPFAGNIPAESNPLYDDAQKLWLANLICSMAKHVDSLFERAMTLLDIVETRFLEKRQEDSLPQTFFRELL